MPLEGYQRRYLRGLAHGLDPAVQVGKAGLSPGVIDAIGTALDAHELIKVRLAGSKAEKRELIARLEEELGCHQAGMVGHVAMLYRQQPDPEKRRIVLPLRD